MTANEMVEIPSHFIIRREPNEGVLSFNFFCVLGIAAPWRVAYAMQLSEWTSYNFQTQSTMFESFTFSPFNYVALPVHVFRHASTVWE